MINLERAVLRPPSSVLRPPSSVLRPPSSSAHYIHIRRNFLISFVIIALFFTFVGCDSGSDGGSSDPTDPAVTWPAGLTALKGDKLSSVVLTSFTNNPPGKFTWAKPSTTLNASGEHDMNFIPDDAETYNTVKKGVTVTVALQEIEMEMLLIKGGTFMMGSPNGEARRNATFEDQHQVTLSPFYLGKYEVTREQYKAVMGADPSKAETADGENADRQPVDYVNWYDAVIFCNKLSLSQGLTPAYRSLGNNTDPDAWGEPPSTYSDENRTQWDAILLVAGSNGYRLPTEAQWEYACRAGTTTAYFTGNDIDGNYVWYGVNSGNPQTTHEVGLKYGNAGGLFGEGLYDMMGNVEEWCWDWIAAYLTTAQTDPTGPTSGTTASNRATRGGGYNSAITNNSSHLRSAARRTTSPTGTFGGNGPYTRANYIGFRVARPAQ